MIVPTIHIHSRARSIKAMPGLLIEKNSQDQLKFKIRKDLEQIFLHRNQALEKLFGIYQSQNEI